MHRATPLNSSFRAFTGGGTRGVVDIIDDSKLMQEMKANFMANEVREAIESPQNYGFSSVVLPALKDQAGKILESAEHFISFMGGNRTFPVCTVMDDRRHRPRSLVSGGSAQYGPNTDYGRSLTYIKPTPQQDSSSSSGGGSSGASTRDASGGGGSSEEYGLFMVVPHPDEYISMRHINNKKQPKPQSQGQTGQQGSTGAGTGASTRDTSSSGNGSSSSGQDQYNHEKGDSINAEVRCTKSRIEFRFGDNVVGYYDSQSTKWSFTGEMRLGDDNASDPVYGVNGGAGQTTKIQGPGAVLVTAPNPGPPTSLDNQPLMAINDRIAMLEARIATLEARTP